MKSFTPIILLLSIAFFSSENSTAQSFLWAHTGNYDNYTHLIAMKKDHAGDFYIATWEDSVGTTLSTKIERRDSTQSVLWSIEFTGDVQITDIEINSLNHVVAVGYFQDSLMIGTHLITSPLMHSAFIFAADATGFVTWAVSFNPSGEEFRPVDLFIDRSDNLYLTADIAGVHGFCSFHKLDMWGSPLMNEFNDNTELRTFSNILADDNGNVFISGTCGNGAVFDSIPTPINASYQNMLVKYDPSFNAQWLIARPYITFDNNNSLGSDGQSLYWAFNEATTNADSIRLVKTDYNGQILVDAAGPLGYSFFPAITFSNDSSGNGVLSVNVFNRIYLYRTDNQFNITWFDSIMSHTSGFPAEMEVNAEDSSFYVCAKYWGDSLAIGPLMLLNPHGASSDYDIFLAKWGYDSNISVPSVNSESLISTYPNPANDKLIIRYGMNVPAMINVLDYTGKVCYRKNISGLGKYEIDLSKFSSGIYFVRVQNKDSGHDWVDKIVVNR